MTPTPRELKPVESARDLFSSELRRLRLGAGMSLDALADIVNYSKSHVHGVEVGDRVPLPPLPEKLDAAFGSGKLFAGLWVVIKRERVPKRFDRCLELEATATRIQEYGASVIPGLLQTEAYMRALFTAAHPEFSMKEVDRLTAERLSRQERLKSDNPPDLWAILDEAVLRRTTGGPVVMREQLEALLPYVDTTHTTVQIMPFSHYGYPIMNGTVILLTLPDGSTALYEEGGETGEMIEDRLIIARRIRGYDRMKAHALSAGASARYIEAVLEDYRQCEPPPS
ncbi:helix-turn-helix domain-containing protein [Actinacidiphila yeochonensis]|uniref:helix-turn-helix domain-containing protein n=1 Tax=Actinacidiphila yeochonensis TaxID=89050 RepID=UPI0005667679|nr:helix-turn-helix transcriptional regulator [Actinacidiphila yeochonensis]